MSYRTVTGTADVAAPSPAAGAPVASTAPGLPGATAGTPPAGPGEPTILASGIYVTGSSALQSGSRYTLVLEGPSLRVLGPVDLRPQEVVAECPISLIIATGFGDRLVISPVEGASRRILMVFSGLGGSSTEALAARLTAAVDTQRATLT